MQLLFDFFPVIAFFVAYKLTDIYVATGVIIVAVVVQTAVQWVRHRKVSSMALISGALVLVFGGLTLIIHDTTFIQWKVTVVNWLFAVAFAASRYFGDRTIIERLLGENLTLEQHLWRRLNWAWALFFSVVGAVNLYVAYNFPEASGSTSSSSGCSASPWHSPSHRVSGSPRRCSRTNRPADRREQLREPARTHTLRARTSAYAAGASSSSMTVTCTRATPALAMAAVTFAYGSCQNSSRDCACSSAISSCIDRWATLMQTDIHALSIVAQTPEEAGR